MKSIFYFELNGKHFEVSKSEFLDCVKGCTDEWSERLYSIVSEGKNQCMMTEYYWKLQ